LNNDCKGLKDCVQTSTCAWINLKHKIIPDAYA
jgi:hypothetical protein